MKTEVSFSTFFIPKEEMLAVKKDRRGITLGIPKESDNQENRIPLSPNGVDLLIKNGFEIYLETGAGVRAGFSDQDYSEIGAQIVYNSEEAWKQSIVLKVGQPNEQEVDWLQPNALLISSLRLDNIDSIYFKKLQSKKISALAYELFQDDHGMYTIVRTMSEIAGNSVIQLASYYLSNSSGGKGRLLGGMVGIPPTEIVVLGSGTVAEYATRAALGLGASVKVFDTSIHRLRRFQMMFEQRVYTALLNPQEIEKALINADVVIGAMRGNTGRSPMVIFDHHVQQMKEGAVLIDVSIDRGGCSETSHITNIENPIYKKYGVIHYCVPNIASSFAQTASQALSNIFTPLLIDLINNGGLSTEIAKNKYLRSSLYLYQGRSTNRFLSRYFDIKHTNLNLFFP
jgi:alanine dehydrogenase